MGRSPGKSPWIRMTSRLCSEFHPGRRMVTQARGEESERERKWTLFKCTVDGEEAEAVREKNQEKRELSSAVRFQGAELRGKCKLLYSQQYISAPWISA